MATRILHVEALHDEANTDLLCMCVFPELYNGSHECSGWIHVHKLAKEHLHTNNKLGIVSKAVFVNRVQSTYSKGKQENM